MATAKKLLVRIWPPLQCTLYGYGHRQNAPCTDMASAKMPLVRIWPPPNCILYGYGHRKNASCTDMATFPKAQKYTMYGYGHLQSVLKRPMRRLAHRQHVPCTHLPTTKGHHKNLIGASARNPIVTKWEICNFLLCSGDLLRIWPPRGGLGWPYPYEVPGHKRKLHISPFVTMELRADAPMWVLWCPLVAGK